MSSVNLLDFFAADPVRQPDPDLALRASFGIPDIERLLRENKELRAERDALKVTIVALKATIAEIKEMIEQWRAVRQAIHAGRET